MAQAWQSDFGIGRRKTVFVLVLMLGLALAVFLVKIQVSPWYVNMSEDSALFAYGGQRIVEGELLYQGVWDTKPPGIFYINALAIAIGEGTPWSVWWFELVWFTFTSLILLWILTKLAGVWSGLLATGLFVFTALHPSYIGTGNFTEVYALLPQVLTIGAAAAYFSSGKGRWLAIVGVLTAAAFLLKPTYIALGAATFIVAMTSRLLAQERRTALTHALICATGFLIPLALAAAYWAAAGALDDLWSAVFIENVKYVREGFSLASLVGTARKFIVEQPLASLAVLTLAALVIFLVDNWPFRLRQWLVRSESDVNRFGGLSHRRWLLLTIFLALPMEVALIAASGRNFGHYFITALPAMSVACAYLFESLGRGLRRHAEFSPWLTVTTTLILLLIAAWTVEVLGKELPGRDDVADIFIRPFSGGYLSGELELYVLENTDPDDSILAWGYNPLVHFLTGRRASSRYLFHTQLLAPSPGRADRFDQFMIDLESDPPALVLAEVDSPHRIPFFADPNFDLCFFCVAEAEQELAKLNEYVEVNYSREGRVGDWEVFRRRE
ncbi:MAG: ArnT family glycosyltransferase [Anaerolineales bacterium]